MFEARRFGYVVLAKGDTRLLDATLSSMASQRIAPAVVVVVVPERMRHLYAGLELGGSGYLVQKVFCFLPESAVSEGLSAIAWQVDVAVFAPEGVVLDADHLGGTVERFSRFEDLVGRHELVQRSGEAASRHGPASVSQTRRPPALTNGILAVRVRACRGIAAGSLPTTWTWLAFSQFQARLRPRGRTETAAAQGATHEVKQRRELRSSADDLAALYNALLELSRDPVGPVLAVRRESASLLLYVLAQTAMREPQVRGALGKMFSARRAWRARSRSLAHDLHTLN